MVFSSEINGFGRSTASGHSQRPKSHYRALPSALTPPFHCCQAQIGGDGDCLWRSIDDFLSQMMLLTDEE